MTTAILDVRPTARAPAAAASATTDFVRLLGLDRLPARHPLACVWRRDEQGRLCCRWEVDLAPAAAPADGENR